jgi:hypothetical protein
VKCVVAHRAPLAHCPPADIPHKLDRSIRTFDAKTLQPLLVIGGPLPGVGGLLDNNGIDEFPPNDEMEGHRAAVNAVSLTPRYM